MTRAFAAPLLAALLATLCFAATGQSPEEILGHIESGDLDRAHALAQQRVAANEDDAEAHYLAARVATARGEAEAAVASMERAVKLDPDNAVYHRTLGDTYADRIADVGTFGQMRMAGKIRKSYTRAVELDPDDIEARMGLLMYYLNAPGIAGGSAEKALEQAREIGSREPARGAIAEALVHQATGDVDAAVAALREAIRLDPEPLDPYVALAVRLADRGDYDESMAVLDGRLATHPEEMLLQYQVGRTASISGKFLERGASALQRYVSDYDPGDGEPNHAWAVYRLGLIHRHAGDDEEARAAFERALALDSTHAEARAALNALPSTTSSTD